MNISEILEQDSVFVTSEEVDKHVKSLMLIAAPLLLLSLSRYFVDGWNSVYLLHLCLFIGLVYLTFKRDSLLLKKIFLIVFFDLIGVGSVVGFQLWGFGGVGFVVATILCFATFNIRLAGLNLMSILIFGSVYFIYAYDYPLRIELTILPRHLVLQFSALMFFLYIPLSLLQGIRKRASKMQLELREQFDKAEIANALLTQGNEMVNLGHAVWDDNLGRDVMVSNELARIHGLEQADYLETVRSIAKYADLIVPEDREAYLGHEEDFLVHAMDPNHLGDHQYRIKRPNGEIRYLRKRARYLPVTSGRPHEQMIVIQDVTDQKQAEIHLKESEALLSQSAKMAEMGYAVWSDNLREHVTVSDNYASIFGYEPDQYLAKFRTFEASIELVYPIDRDRYTEWYESDSGDEHEYRIIRRDGEIRHLLRRFFRLDVDKGESDRVLVIIQDITKRKSEELYRQAVIEQSFDCIVTIDDSGRIRDFNPAAEKTFLYDRAEVIGKKIADVIIPPRYKEAHNNGMAHYHATGDAPVLNQLLELEALRSDGVEIPIEITITQLNLDSVVHFTAYIQDISERKAVEESLKRSVEETQKASNSKSAVLATMSHEIRTPLNAIMGSIGLLEDTKLSSEQKDYLKVSRVAGKSLLRIINDVIDTARVESGHLEIEPSWFLMKSLEEDVTEVFEFSTKENGVDFAVSIAPDLPDWFYGDAGRVRQVLFNLVGNAIKFSSQGSVSVEVKKTGSENWFRFTVSDTGIGIPKDRKSEIFDAFSQVDSSLTRRQSGSGLGLSICRRLVEAMGGVLDFESTESDGSTFWFDLPLESSDSGGDKVDELEPGERVGSIDMPADKPFRVLLAEDSPANQLVIRNYLERAGLQVNTVANGLEAIQQAQKFPYDVILMDISMPEMDGLEATKRLRDAGGLTRNIPIIGLTAHALPEIRDKCLEVGMSGFLTKPISKDQLLKALKETLDPD